MLFLSFCHFCPPDFILWAYFIARGLSLPLKFQPVLLAGAIVQPAPIPDPLLRGLQLIFLFLFAIIYPLRKSLPYLLRLVLTAFFAAALRSALV